MDRLRCFDLQAADFESLLQEIRIAMPRKPGKRSFFIIQTIYTQTGSKKSPEDESSGPLSNFT